MKRLGTALLLVAVSVSVVRASESPVPCEWYPEGWPNATAEAIADPSGWWQHDPDGTCAIEVPANVLHTPIPTLPPTDTLR